MDAAWMSPSSGWILGWTLLHSLWQGALVAGGLWLVLRFLPGGMVRLRSAAAWSALLLVIGLAAGTWLLIDTDWRTHAACWESEAYAVSNAPMCAAHVVPAARAALGDDRSKRAASPIAWVDRMAMPVPGFFRSLSARATSGVAAFTLIWSALALAALVQLSIGLRLLRGILRRSTPLAGDPSTGGPDRGSAGGLGRGSFDELLARVGAEMRVTGPVELRETTEISTPAVAGWRRPVILVPRGMAETLGRDRLGDVLAHELVHVRERHFAVNLAQRSIDCLCLFNPFALWISSRIREEREVHCDRIAAGPPASGRRRYVETLLQLEYLRTPTGPALVGLVGEGSLLRRIRRLGDSGGGGVGPDGTRRAMVAAGAAATTVALVALFSMTMVSLTSWAVMTHDIDARRTALIAAPAAIAAEPGASPVSGAVETE